MGHHHIEAYRLLTANARTALVSLFSSGLRNTTLLQLAKLSTGSGEAYSVYAVYREEQMTFEVSARLTVLQQCQPPRSILCSLVADPDFRETILVPLKTQVDTHFARERC